MFKNRAAAAGIIVLAITGPCVLSGCGSMEKAGEHLVATENLWREWNLSAIEGRPVGDLFPGVARAPSLKFADDGSVSGFAGVNRLASSIDLEALAAGRFLMSPAVTTKMAGPPDAMRLESQFTQLLERVRQFDVSAEALSLTDGVNELLRFVLAP